MEPANNLHITTGPHGAPPINQSKQRLAQNIFMTSPPLGIRIHFGRGRYRKAFPEAPPIINSIQQPIHYSLQ